MPTFGVVLWVQKGALFRWCIRDAKRCILLVLRYGCKELRTSGVLLGVERDAYFWTDTDKVPISKSPQLFAKNHTYWLLSDQFLTIEISINNF